MSAQFDKLNDKERGETSVTNDEVRTSGSSHQEYDDKAQANLKQQPAQPVIADGGARAWMSVAGGYVFYKIFFEGTTLTKRSLKAGSLHSARLVTLSPSVSSKISIPSPGHPLLPTFHGSALSNSS